MLNGENLCDKWKKKPKKKVYRITEHETQNKEDIFGKIHYYIWQTFLFQSVFVFFIKFFWFYRKSVNCFFVKYYCKWYSFKFVFFQQIYFFFFDLDIHSICCWFFFFFFFLICFSNQDSCFYYCVFFVVFLHKCFCSPKLVYNMNGFVLFVSLNFMCVMCICIEYILSVLLIFAFNKKIFLFCNHWRLFVLCRLN